MWYVCDVLYAVLYVCVCCFVVCGCAVSRRYIDVCYCDMFSVVNVYLDHLKFCLVCINCDDICMCVVNKQFELIEFVLESDYVDLQYYEISLTFASGYVCLCGVCSPVVILGLSVRLWYPMLWVRLLR